MRISGTEPWSLILPQTEWFKKLKSDYINFPGIYNIQCLSEDTICFINSTSDFNISILALLVKDQSSLCDTLSSVVGPFVCP